MTPTDGTGAPIWAEAKARQGIDVLQEVSRSLAAAEIERATKPMDRMTEPELEMEQLRLEELLHFGVITVGDFRRLREIDFYLEGMQDRRQFLQSQEGWSRESTGE